MNNPYKLVICLLCLSILTAAASAQTDQPILVYFLGQSNAGITILSTQEKEARKAWTFPKIKRLSAAGFIAHEMGSNYNFDHKKAPSKEWHLGAEAACVRSLQEQTNAPVYFAKYSQGGTSLGMNPNKPDFHPDSQQYFLGILQSVKRGMELMSEKHDDFELHFVWIHGEADSRKQHFADAYQENLQCLYDDLRAAVGQDELNFILVKIRDGLPKDRFPHRTSVQQAQQRFVNANPKSALLDPSMFPVKQDQVHYSADGYDQMGLAIAQLILGAQ